MQLSNRIWFTLFLPVLLFGYIVAPIFLKTCLEPGIAQAASLHAAVTMTNLTAGGHAFMSTLRISADFTDFKESMLTAGAQSNSAPPSRRILSRSLSPKIASPEKVYMYRRVDASTSKKGSLQAPVESLMASPSGRPGLGVVVRLDVISLHTIACIAVGNCTRRPPPIYGAPKSLPTSLPSSQAPTRHATPAASPQITPATSRRVTPIPIKFFDGAEAKKEGFVVEAKHDS